MGVRENKVERYLHKQVEKLGGTTRKWVSPGYDGVPDRLVFFTGLPIFLIEVKTVDGELSEAQRREHGRLKGHGCAVYTVYGSQGVDDFIIGVKFKLGVE